ncbi:MAG: hypothetical protein LBQ59_03290 [Candidatus Peribacteria bacterium]|nr:hypothetical protein [Candidatus Peribacteria bacterium]
MALKWTNLEQSYTDHLFIDASLWKKFVGVDDFITEPADENIATNSIDTLTLP